MQIQSEAQTLERIFTGVSTRYSVPHYQRDYTWSEDQWNELWTDITTAFRHQQEYFLGSFVLNTESQASTGIYEIVDGQQRLTTFTIVFSVIRDIARFFEAQPTHSSFNHVQKDEMSRDKSRRTATKAGALIVHLSEPDNYFLRLNDKDHPTFFSAIQKENEPLLDKESRKTTRSESRLTKGKKFFTRKVLEDFLSLSAPFHELEKFVTFCMTRLTLLKIAVGSDNDAYLLFETLNDRGLDLSISDLVKNRLLLGCDGDADKKRRVLDAWNELTARLEMSRFQAHDFLRFYWCAFHRNCTKKELYRLIRDQLVQEDGEELVTKWLGLSEYFCGITDRNLRFPSSGLSLGTTQCFYAELNTLGYSVYLPLFLYLKRNRPELLDGVVEPSTSYLFRIITVGNFSAGRAETAFNEALEGAKAGRGIAEINDAFSGDSEASDEKLIERVQTQRFEENKAAKHFLSKLHLFKVGQGHPLNNDIHLEHILPQKSTAWPQFPCGGRLREDWVYSIGNMTLLEESLNASIQASPFTIKVDRFRQRLNAGSNGTAIPMTYEIFNEFSQSGRSWSQEWIRERALAFASQAPAVWPLKSPQVIEARNASEPAQDNGQI